MSSAIADICELLFVTRGVGSVVADFQRQEKAATSFEVALAKVGSSGGGTAANIAGAFQAAAAASAAAVAVLTTEIALVDVAISKYIDYGKAIQSVSSLSGASVSASAHFVNLSRVAGVPDQQAIREIMRLSKDMNSAQGQGAMARLGVSPVGKDTLQEFTEVTARLSAMKDGAGKTALEMQLFGGRLTQSLQPYLHMSGDIIDRTNALSSTIDGNALQAINHFQQSWNLLNQTIVIDFLEPIASRLLPVFDFVITKVQTFIHWIGEMDKKSGGMLTWVTIIGGIGIGFVAAAVAAGKLIAVVQTLINAEKIQAVILAVIDALSGNWKNLAAAAAIGGASYVAINALQHAGDDDSAQNAANGGGRSDDPRNPANSTNSAAREFGEAVRTFADTVNGMSWGQVMGSQGPSGLTEADYAMISSQRAQGAVG